MWDGASMIRVMIAGFAAASFDSPWPRILAAINPLSLVGLEILRNARYSNLYVIYSMLVRRECKDPRDRVYAIRGICSATYKFEVNYDKSIEEVGVDWSWSEICKTKTLDIFTTCNSHQLKPSWVPNLRNPSQNRDVSLDKSRDGHIPYSASGRLSCDAKLSESRLQLTLTGLPIDHVAHVIDSRVTQKAAELAEHLLQESSKDQISQETREKLILFEDFINFLACYPDREVFGADFLCIKFLEFIIISYLGIEWSDRTKTFPVAERLANVIFRGFRRTSASGNSYTTLAHYMEWWNSSPIPADYRPDEGDTSRREAYFSDLKLAMQLHLRNMHIIVTSSGRIGLFIATCEVLVGDHIYVLLGGKTPFILRKGGERYELVTSCYLENFMDGEAITEWEAKRIVSEEITLV
ncbi:hypothetical protein N431DRAFT_429303 [Stipitochalara longipes BDJ]|nr:hypothetical protein N431DRAFT_429303 [Stipitochalara longipes BDJ]